MKKTTRKEKFPNLNRPAHYTAGEREAIDYMKDMGIFEHYAVGNVVKYMYRYRHKDNAVGDLIKALHYIDMLIQWMEDEDARESMEEMRTEDRCNTGGKESPCERETERRCERYRTLLTLSGGEIPDQVARGRVLSGRPGSSTESS